MSDQPDVVFPPAEHSETFRVIAYDAEDPAGTQVELDPRDVPHVPGPGAGLAKVTGVWAAVDYLPSPPDDAIFRPWDEVLDEMRLCDDDK